MIPNSLVPFTACSTFLEDDACLEQASEEVNTITATLNQTERPAVINQLARHTLNFFNNEVHTELLSDKLKETNNTKLYDAFGALSYSFSTFKEASAKQAMQQIETVLKEKKDYAIPDEETLKIVPLKEWISAGWYLDPTLATKTENLASLIDAAAIPCVRTCTHDVRINMNKLKTPSSISPAQVVYFARLILEYLNHFSVSLALLFAKSNEQLKAFKSLAQAFFQFPHPIAQAVAKKLWNLSMRMETYSHFCFETDFYLWCNYFLFKENESDLAWRIAENIYDDPKKCNIAANVIIDADRLPIAISPIILEICTYIQRYLPVVALIPIEAWKEVMLNGESCRNLGFKKDLERTNELTENLIVFVNNSILKNKILLGECLVHFFNSHSCQEFATELTREINSNSDQHNAIKLLENMKQLEKAFDLPLTQDTRSKIRKIINGVQLVA
jgi:hypothetical protein